MKSLSQIYVVTLLLFIFFPFIKILPIASYTQPYSYILALGIFKIRYLGLFPNKERILLSAFTLSGLFIFLFTAFPYYHMQEIKYILIYLAPFLFSIVAFYIMRFHRNILKHSVEVAILVWFVVGVIQLLLSPNFLNFLISFNNDMGQRMLNSGRGVVSMAPEPTHFGLHMLVLGAIYSLLGTKRYPYLLVVISVVFIAKSTTAVMVLIAGLACWSLLHLRKKLFKILAGLLFGLVFLVFFGDSVFSGTRMSRIYELYRIYGFSVLEVDHSASSRIGGMVLAYKTSFLDLFFPHGMSHAAWLNNSREIISRNIWLLNLSQVGFPSGFGVVLYQIGFLGFSVYALFILLLKKSIKKNTLYSLSIIIIFLVFNSQLYISAATFGLFLGVIIFQLKYQVQQ